jgi:hypothetical protein
MKLVLVGGRFHDELSAMKSKKKQRAFLTKSSELSVGRVYRTTNDELLAYVGRVDRLNPVHGKRSTERIKSYAFVAMKQKSDYKFVTTFDDTLLQRYDDKEKRRCQLFTDAYNSWDVWSWEQRWNFITNDLRSEPSHHVFDSDDWHNVPTIVFYNDVPRLLHEESPELGGLPDKVIAEIRSNVDHKHRYDTAKATNYSLEYLCFYGTNYVPEYVSRYNVLPKIVEQKNKIHHEVMSYFIGSLLWHS